MWQLLARHSYRYAVVGNGASIVVREVQAWLWARTRVEGAEAVLIYNKVVEIVVLMMARKSLGREYGIGIVIALARAHIDLTKSVEVDRFFVCLSNYGILV